MSAELVLFVSCVEGKPVSRYPLPGRRGSAVVIGARRDGRRTIYDETEIVALTGAEVRAHGKIYERAIREGDLRRRTRAEWEAARAAQKLAAASAATATNSGPTSAGGEST